MYYSAFFPLFVCLILTVIASISFLFNFINKPEKEIYLIPNDFHGRGMIIYGEPCGTLPDYEGKQRIIRIPKNGILIIQPKFKAGLIDNQYYMINNKNGARKKLYELFNYKERFRKSPSIITDGNGRFGGDSYMDQYVSFRVFNKDLEPFQKEDIIDDDKSDSQAIALLEECRYRYKHRHLAHNRLPLN